MLQQGTMTSKLLKLLYSKNLRIILCQIAIGMIASQERHEVEIKFPPQSIKACNYTMVVLI